jgi:serine/threonine-protein kinase RsbW
MTPTPDRGGAGASHTCVLSSEPLAVRAGLVGMATQRPLSLLTPDQRGTVEVVLAEVLNNIAEHAYAGGPGKITVTLRLGGAGLACQVTDDGVPMPDGRLPDGAHPMEQLSIGGNLADVALEDLPEGGFGWNMIRLLTEGLHYVRVGGQNRLSFVIRL